MNGVPEKTLICLQVFHSLPEAQVVRSRLEAADIECSLVNENFSGLYGGTMEIKLFIDEKDYQKARKVLRFLKAVE